MKRELDAASPVDRELVEDVGAAGERGRNLARQLLMFARRQALVPELLDLNEVVRGSENLLRRTIREDVRLDLVLQPGLWTTFCDRGQAEQVLLNLAANARDAMMSGRGTLVIETRNVEVEPAESATNPEEQAGQWVRLRVSDSGSGLSLEARAHLFEPFFTTKAPGKGTGLGLATVHGFVTQSGGHVHVQSEPGKGTTIDVRLPRRSGPAEAPRLTPARGTSVRGSETVLVVEDDRAVRDFACW
jgi:two-component system cell cycle sensor histidine kinase/response regulator CckA